MTDLTSPAPIAAIDCGTNTIKLLIATPEQELVREARMVRLGEGVDRTRRLSPAALERTFAAVEEYAELIAAQGATRVRFCATSATRDAENAADFRAGVLARLGVLPEVLSGADEAGLAFSGAVRRLSVAAAEQVLVIDIGGGSTELILGAAADGSVEQAHSMDIGSVRLHERHLHADPPTAAEVAAAQADIDAALDASPVELNRATRVVGVAGTITTVAAGVLDLPAYDRDAIDQQSLPVAEVHAVVDRLVAMSRDERLALPWMHPGRADVIGAGALILSAVLRRCQRHPPAGLGERHPRRHRLVAERSRLTSGQDHVAGSAALAYDDAMISVTQLALVALGGPNDPPQRCFVMNEAGELPTCTYSGGTWTRSYGSDPFLGSQGGDPGGAFAALFGLMIVAAIALTVWKVSTARRMARDSGMSERDATTMALLSDDGFEATYLAANLRGQTAPPVPGPGGGRTVAERLRELDKLRAEDLLSVEEHERARQTILGSL